MMREPQSSKPHRISHAPPQLVRRGDVAETVGADLRLLEVSAHRVVAIQLPHGQLGLGPVVDRLFDEAKQAAMHPIHLRVADEVARHEPSKRREERARKHLPIPRQVRRLGDEPPEPRMVGCVDAPHRDRG